MTEDSDRQLAEKLAAIYQRDDGHYQRTAAMATEIATYRLSIQAAVRDTEEF